MSAVELFAERARRLRELEAARQGGADPRFTDTRYPYGISIGTRARR